MSGWFSKASHVFRRATPEVDHPFEIACDCGEVHRGLRRSRFQKLICRDCGAAKFVLPRDVYPAPREARAAAIVAPEPIPVLAPVEVEPLRRTNGSATTDATLSTKRLTAEKKKKDKDQTPELLIPAARQKFWTPLRFVMLGISLCCVLIVLVLVRKQQRDYATLDLRTASEDVQELIAGGDWVAARDRYQSAVRSVDILGRDDAPARRYRQGLRETTALSAMSPGSLVEVLKEAETHADDREGWERMFQSRYRGQWLVFETPIRLEESESGEKKWRFDFPVPIGKAARVVSIDADLNAFNKLKTRDESQPIIFAAQLETCELSQDRARWKVALNPETGFLWAHPMTYDALGFVYSEWHPREVVVALLKAQADSMEVEFEDEEP